MRLPRWLYVAATTAMSTGCYHATIETGATPSADVVEKSFASGWIYGLVPPGTVSTAARCPHGAAKVETKLSFVNQLVGFLTLGIYTPMNIKVTCAASGTGTAATLAPTGALAPLAKPDTATAADTVHLAPGAPAGRKWIASVSQKLYYPATVLRQLAGEGPRWGRPGRLSTFRIPERNAGMKERGRYCATCGAPVELGTPCARCEPDKAARHASGKTAMTDFPGREARLKPQFAHLYPAITAGQWDSAAVLADRMVSWLLRNPNPRIVTTSRILPPEHFDFRGDVARPDSSSEERSRREDQQ